MSPTVDELKGTPWEDWNVDPDGDPQQTKEQAIEEAMPYIRAEAYLRASQASSQPGAMQAQEDLAAVGFEELVKASERWDPSKGKLSTYAFQRVRGAMLRYLSENLPAIRVPEALKERAFAIRRAQLELAAELGRQPSDEEMIEFKGFTSEEMREMRRTMAVLQGTESLNRDLDEEHDEETEGDPEFTPLQVECGLMGWGAHERHSNLRSALTHLSELEQEVIALEFGLDGPRLPIKEIADRLGLTPREVSKVSQLAKASLRHSSFEGMFDL